MPAPYPHQYHVGLSWHAGQQQVLAAPPRPEIVGGTPPEFDGTDSVWSPEHLLLSSLSLCMMLTFKALAERAKLPLEGYSCRAEGVVDKSGGAAAFSRVTLRVDVKSPERERAQALLQTAKKYCIISNSLKAAVTVEAGA